MSLKAKIEAIIYAADEPVTLVQLAALLGEDVQQELDALDAQQPELPMSTDPEAASLEVADAQAAGPGAPEQQPDAEPESIETQPAAEFGEPQTEPETATDEVTEASPETPVAEGEAVVETAPDGEPEAVAQAEAVTGLETASPAGPEAVPPQVVTEAAPVEPLFVDEKKRERRVREYLRGQIAELMKNYEDRGVQITEVASGYRMSTKPEYHDVIRGFAKSLKPALKLSLPALETLAVIAYKQPVTAAEVSDIRGVDSGGVLGGLMTRKLITTAGRKQVIGRPILYKTTKEFLLRFGLKDTAELPSIEEFEKMAGELAEQEDLAMEPNFNTDVIPQTPEPDITPNPDVIDPLPAGDGEMPGTPAPEPQPDGSGDSVESPGTPATPESPAQDVVPGEESTGEGEEERDAQAGIENV